MNVAEFWKVFYFKLHCQLALNLRPIIKLNLSQILKECLLRTYNYS